MINFNSKITKSIIIAIFLLSLTISIYIVPASAIVTGSLPLSDIYPVFDLNNYNYFRVRNGGSVSSTYSGSLDYYQLWSSEWGTVLPDETDRFWYVARFGNTVCPVGSYIRFFLPLGIKGSDSITIKFALGINSSVSSGSVYQSAFDSISSNSIRNGYVSFGLVSNGTYDINSSVYEYNGTTFVRGNKYSPGGSLTSGNIVMQKVYEITINNFDYVNYIYIDYYPQTEKESDLSRYVMFGVNSIYYEGANVQLTNIQSSIDSVISSIENQSQAIQQFTQQQLEFYEDILQLSPSGQQVISDLKDNFSSSESGLDDLIQGITVEKPNPDQILPDNQIIIDQYMDSGGSEALGSIITPLFDEKGPIYIMLFSVFSIALISYVLYGKKA